MYCRYSRCDIDKVDRWILTVHTMEKGGDDYNGGIERPLSALVSVGGGGERELTLS